MKCPKCGAVLPKVARWQDYLKKEPGWKVHFLSMTGGTPEEPKISRTRLFFRKTLDHGNDLDLVRATLELVAIEHKNDPYFRWIDTYPSTIDEVINRLAP